MDAVKDPTVPKQPPVITNYLTQNVNNIEVLARTEANFQLGISRYRSFALLQG